MERNAAFCGKNALEGEAGGQAETEMKEEIKGFKISPPRTFKCAAAIVF